MIDECSNLKSSTDDTLLKRITQANENHSNSGRAKGKENFLVKHTAKNVEYTINDFIAKNLDEITTSIKDTICKSSN